MAKAYSELETKLGQPKTEPAAATAATPAAQADTKIPTLGENPPVKTDLSKYEQEFTSTGKLSDQSFAELEAAGYPKATSVEEKKAFNQAVNSGHVESAKLAVAGIRAKYTTALGSNPALVGGRANPNTGPQPYGSWDQVRVAMGDKRYSNDPAFRKEVEGRLAVSTLG
jgi:hypothetical protein